MTDHDPDGRRLPIKIDSTSNGEFVPQSLGAAAHLGNRLAFERATDHARSSGVSRRSFLVSAMGAATTLLAHNDAQVAGEVSIGIIDRLILTDQTADIFGDHPRALFQRRIGQDLIGLHSQARRRRDEADRQGKHQT